MTNNTNAISVSADFDMTALLSILQNSKATVIVINNGTPVDMSNIIDTTATEVKKEHTFNYHNFCVGRVKQVLRQHDIKVKTGMGGCKKGHISASAFNKFVLQLEIPAFYGFIDVRALLLIDLGKGVMELLFCL